MRTWELRTPLGPEVERLRPGDRVLLSGQLWAARDVAHRLLAEALRRGEPLPVELRGGVIYYMGPSPAPPGRPIGAAGPTTSSRMDPYTPQLLALGLRATIGKGRRSPEVIRAMVEHRAVYLGAPGGCGALLGLRVRRAEVVAFEELGPEAIWRLEVEALPLIVINDVRGGDLYEEARRRWRRG